MRHGYRWTIWMAMVVLAACGGDTTTTTQETATARTAGPSTAEPNGTSGPSDARCVDPDERLDLEGRFWANPVDTREAERGATPTPDPTFAAKLVSNSITLKELDDQTLEGTFDFLGIKGRLINGKFGAIDESRRTPAPTLPPERHRLDGTVSPMEGSEPVRFDDDLGREITLTTFYAEFENAEYPQAKKCMFSGEIRGGGVLRVAPNGQGQYRLATDEDVDTDIIVLFRHFDLWRKPQG